jgi:hypothetical protein
MEGRFSGAGVASRTDIATDPRGYGAYASAAPYHDAKLRASSQRLILTTTYTFRRPQCTNRSRRHNKTRQRG